MLGDASKYHSASTLASANLLFTTPYAILHLSIKHFLKKQPVYPTEAALRLQAVIDTAIDGILTIDEKGIVESINPAAAQLFGYQPKEVIGNNVKMLMPMPYRMEHDNYIRRYLDTREPHIIGSGREAEGKKKDGTVFPMRLAVSEVIIEGKHIFTGIIHDLTAVKKAEQEILQLNKDLEQKVKERTDKLAQTIDKLLETNQKLETEIHERRLIEATLKESQEDLKIALKKEKELSELKGRFLSMASHEFRTPLSTILSSIELIEVYTKTEQQVKRERHIARVKSAVTNLLGVLNDLLSLSRLDEGKVRLEKEYFLLQRECRHFIEDIRAMLKNGQQLHYEDGAIEQEVFLDKKALRIIVHNLLSNAIKYSEEGKSIFCKIKIQNNQLHIQIQDEGIGIPESDQKHLFDRFFRAHNVENIQGTGLGLNIVKQYLDLLNGKIHFKSKYGKGTTFWVAIPLE